MRKRDLGILLLAAFAILFSLQNEGSLSFRQAWVHYKDNSPIKHEAERLPPPVVADLNGDGHVEVVAALEDKLQVQLDPFEEELIAEREMESHRRSAGSKEEEEDLTKKMGGGEERHFSYYAYAGMTGTRRWTHRSETGNWFTPLQAEGYPKLDWTP